MPIVDNKYCHHQQNTRKTFFSYSLGKWIAFMEMIKTQSCNQKSVDYLSSLQEKLERARERKEELKQQVSELQEEIEHSKEAHGCVFFFLYVIILYNPFRYKHCFRFSVEYFSERGKHVTKTIVCIICRVLNNKWKEKSNLIGELEGQVRHIRTTWEDMERKLTQERDRAIDTAR